MLLNDDMHFPLTQPRSWVCPHCHRLAANVITPTTKAADHDEPISAADIVSRGLMSQQDWDTVWATLHPIYQP